MNWMKVEELNISKFFPDSKRFGGSFQTGTFLSKMNSKPFFWYKLSICSSKIRWNHTDIYSIKFGIFEKVFYFTYWYLNLLRLNSIPIHFLPKHFIILLSNPVSTLSTLHTCLTYIHTPYTSIRFRMRWQPDTWWHAMRPRDEIRDILNPKSKIVFSIGKKGIILIIIRKAIVNKQKQIVFEAISNYKTYMYGVRIPFNVFFKFVFT